VSHTSEVTATVTIRHEDGIPEDVTGQVLATLATRAIADYLSGRMATPEAVTARVQSAFIVRTHPVPQVRTGNPADLRRNADGTYTDLSDEGA
jgi:hypothetical protein